MPRGDRTGPLGGGPMTGRGAGRCGSDDRPGYANARAGCGGRGRGWRHMFYATGRPGRPRGGFAPPMPAAGPEVADLEAEAGWLTDRLGAIRKRIAEIEGRGAAPAEP